MQKFMKKLWEKKNSKKGFTLVELIVVLVILAILAAIMIPSMIGWIDKAKEKQIILDARNAEMAAQTVLYEKYAAGTTITATTGADCVDISTEKSDIEKITGTLTGVTLKWKHDDKGNISAFEYTKNGKTAKYNGSTWTVE